MLNFCKPIKDSWNEKKDQFSFIQDSWLVYSVITFFKSFNLKKKLTILQINKYYFLFYMY